MSAEPNPPPGEIVWPSCPQCHRRRYATCPYCQTSSDRFDQAEAAWEGDHEVIRVICPTCDEPFEPKFRGRCHGCGYYFDGAAPIAEPAERPPETEPNELDRRSLLALVTIAAVLTGLIVYFAWLLRRPGRA